MPVLEHPIRRVVIAGRRPVAFAGVGFVVGVVVAPVAVGLCPTAHVNVRARLGSPQPTRSAPPPQRRPSSRPARCPGSIAPANRRELFEGTVNVHWEAGAELRAKPGDEGFSARAGDTVVHLDDDADMEHFWSASAGSPRRVSQSTAMPPATPGLA